MSMDGENDEVFDEEELAEGFDEELVVDDVDEVEGEDLGLDDGEIEGDEGEEEPLDLDEAGDDVPAAVVVADDDDLIDDADVELALDEVLAETIRRTTTPEDDEDGPVDVDPLVDPLETILPKQDDEFRCKSCRLLKKMSQLADPAKTLCRDCV